MRSINLSLSLKIKNNFKIEEGKSKEEGDNLFSNTYKSAEEYLDNLKQVEGETLVSNCISISSQKSEISTDLHPPLNIVSSSSKISDKL